MTRGTLTTPPAAACGSSPAGSCVTRFPAPDKIKGTPVAVNAGANSITGEAGVSVAEEESVKGK